MKCEVCGAYNKSEYNKCFRCGAKLKAENSTEKKIILEHQSPLKNTPTFRQAIIVEDRNKENVVKDIIPDKKNKENISEVDFWSENKKKRPFYMRRKAHIPVVSITEEDAETTKPISKRLIRRKDIDDNLSKISKYGEGSEVDVIVPPKKEKKKEKKAKAESASLKWGRLVLVSLIAATVIIGLIIGFFYLFNSVFSGVSSLFAGHDEVPNDGKPLVERIMFSGQSWHRITFYGEDGERILIQDPIRSLSIQDGTAQLLLDDFSYIPSKDTQDENSLPYIEVDLKASLFAKNGEETLLDVPSYNIEVPISPLKIIYPTDPSHKVDLTQVLVKVKVNTGSHVVVDGINLTDIVDSGGFALKYVNLDEGLNKIEIEVETYKHRTNTQYVYVTRPELDVDISLDEPPSSSTTEDVWIYGFIEDDATVYVDILKLSANVSYEEEGKFQFKYKLNSYGWNDIEMNVTAADGRTATLIHRIERIPDHRSYTRNAWPMDYPYLSTSTNALIGQIFVCTGKIISREETETSRMYLFDVGIENSQFIMIEYSGRQEFIVGKKYDVYADVSGTYKNFALLAGRFIYPIEEETQPETTTDE